MGMTAVVGDNGKVVGIFTDGDLRRTMEKTGDFRNRTVREAMTPKPRTVGSGQLAVEAVQLMEEFKITQLLVVDAERKLRGALNMHDLMRAKVI